MFFKKKGCKLRCFEVVLFPCLRSSLEEWCWLLKREPQKWWSGTQPISSYPGERKQGKDRIVIIKSLKGIMNLFYYAPKAEGKLKTEITVRIFCLVKGRHLPHSDPLSLELLKQGLIEHGRGFTVLSGRFLAGSLQAFPLPAPAVFPLNIMFNFTRAWRLESICSIPLK